MSERHRKLLIEAARAMNAAGINQGTSGNLSLRSGAGMLITPSGLAYERLRPDDIVYLPLDGDGRPVVDPESLACNMAVALEAAPCLATINVVRSWAAIVNGTDDWKPLLKWLKKV